MRVILRNVSFKQEAMIKTSNSIIELECVPIPFSYLTLFIVRLLPETLLLTFGFSHPDVAFIHFKYRKPIVLRQMKHDIFFTKIQAIFLSSYTF